MVSHDKVYNQTRFDGFDDRILTLYARGMTVREIQGHLAELYAADVSPDLISRVTDAVIDEVREWQNRPLDQVYHACAAPGRGGTRKCTAAPDHRSGPDHRSDANDHLSSPTVSAEAELHVTVSGGRLAPSIRLAASTSDERDLRL